MTHTWLIQKCSRSKIIFYYACRAIDINGLIGIVGGYVGLFLGYSILQFPGSIAQLFPKLEKCRTRNHNHREKVGPNSLAENIPRNVPNNELPMKFEITRQDESNDLHSIKMQLNHLCEKIQKIEDSRQCMNNK